jgi:two-component system, OmpR family, sensor histidine kinase KdpD
VNSRTFRGTGRRSSLAGLAASIAAATLATVLIYPLKSVAPAVSLGVVYLPAVLVISAYWGLWLGLLTSLVSAAAFNWFHIPPVGQFTIADSRNWVALGAFAIVAAVTSTIAELARARAAEAEGRREEADLAAALASDLLGGVETAAALHAAAKRVTEALGLPSATIDLAVVGGDERRLPIPLSDPRGTRVGTLLVPMDTRPANVERLRLRIAPTLGALIAVALRRDELQREAVETAALRRSDDLKTALLRAVSHDLRTPLTAVVTAGHALAARSLTDTERAELSQAVIEEGGRLATLVDKLLDLSMLQSGRAEPRREPTSIEDVLLAARDAVGDPGGRIRVTVDAEAPAILADAAQLERVFVNLFENARRYSGDAPVLVRARAVGSRLVIRVVDRGPGIGQTDQERIFEPFYRGATNGAPSWSGSGLGLAIAKGFVEASGGEISVESLPGQGTSFVVSFPIAATVGGP